MSEFSVPVGVHHINIIIDASIRYAELTREDTIREAQTLPASFFCKEQIIVINSNLGYADWV